MASLWCVLTGSLLPGGVFLVIFHLGKWKCHAEKLCGRKAHKSPCSFHCVFFVFFPLSHLGCPTRGLDTVHMHGTGKHSSPAPAARSNLPQCSTSTLNVELQKSATRNITKALLIFLFYYSFSTYRPFPNSLRAELYDCNLVRTHLGATAYTKRTSSTIHPR